MKSWYVEHTAEKQKMSIQTSSVVTTSTPRWRCLCLWGSLCMVQLGAWLMCRLFWMIQR